MIPHKRFQKDNSYFQFVAHPHCQQLLASIWYEGIPGWRRHSFLTKVVIIVSLICLLPVMALIYLVLPRSKIGRLQNYYNGTIFVLIIIIIIIINNNK